MKNASDRAEQIVYPAEAEVVASTTTEIGKWLLKLGRVEFAVAQDPQITGGWAPDDPVGDLLRMGVTEPAQAVPDIYEEAVTYELKRRHVTTHNILELANTVPKSFSPHPGVRRRAIFGRRIFRVGLERIGIIDDSGHVVAAALGALCFQRADIKEPIDRRLYDRQEEIETAVSSLKAAAKRPRGTAEVLGVKPIYRISGEQKAVNVPVYSYCFAGRITPEQLEVLGGATAREAFWAELQRELSAIDGLSDNS